MMEIRRRGVNLSEGQQERVALAREIYNDPDICLINSPLCAVEANVGRQIFKRWMVSHFRDIIRVLTTNHLHLSSSQYVNMIVVIFDGKMVEEGHAPDSMRARNSEFSRHFQESGVKLLNRKVVNTKLVSSQIKIVPTREVSTIATICTSDGSLSTT
eukprot:gb/GEZJ01001246.1/.p1 GENE.gb/GEZJ01001246.1/~~gb/GEZJ01001246.1/.p1  ORF type:complete len:157 (+),score=5.47 gb/GEZJ01001246.1/:2205-2675(+)